MKFLNKLFIFSILNLAFNIQALKVWDDFKANYYYEQKDYAKAAKACEQLLLCDAHDPKNLINMGKILYAQGQYNQACHYFEQTLAQNSSSLTDLQKTDLLFAAGSAQAQQEHWQQALQAYEDVLKIAPTHASAQKNSAIIKKILEQKAAQDKANEQKQKQPPKQEQPKTCDKKSSAQDSQEQQDSQDKQDPQESQDEQGKQDQQNSQPNQDPQDSQASKDTKNKQTQAQDQQASKGLENKPAQQANQDQANQNQIKQNQLAQELDQKLTELEKKYLAAVEKSDEQANAYLAQKKAKALKGHARHNEHNW